MKTFEETLSDHMDLLAEEGFIPNYEENDFNAGVIHGFEKGFNACAEFAQRWISVDEELPDDRSDILIKRSHDYVLVKGYYLSSDNSFYCEYIGYPLQFVTHWRYIELK